MCDEQSYISQQMISYLGNKRKLIENIKKYVLLVKPKTCLDGFVGSGVVSRMLKGYCDKLIVNDLESYSIAIQKAYLTNITMEEYNILKEYINYLNSCVSKTLENENNSYEPFISRYYCPKDTMSILEGERCFYSKENGIRIDKYIHLLKNTNINEDIPQKIKDIALGNLLVKCSVNTNTSGVFKAFYKVNNVGCWGGKNKHDLQRILKPITIDIPIFLNNSCKVEYSNDDINNFWINSDNNEILDFVYLDPPYNQHPYGSNYFMLNSIYNAVIDKDFIKNYKIDEKSISGIPKDWNRSDFNYTKTAQDAFRCMIEKTRAKYILISYNDNGFINKDDMLEILKKKGDVSIEEIKYKNLNSRPSKIMADKVCEYLFFIKVNKI